jgi:hypothetical protein
MVASITRIQSPLKFPPESNFDLLLSENKQHTYHKGKAESRAGAATCAIIAFPDFLHTAHLFEGTGVNKVCTL